MKLRANRFRRLALTVVICVLYGVVMNSCMTFRMSPTEVHDYFEKKNIPVTRSSYEAIGRSMTFVGAGDSTKQPVLFVHGSPGSLSAFIDFLGDSTLLDKYFLISVDRPGFGHSGFGNAEKTLARQSEAILPLLEKYHASGKFILVGHSLGGPLIVQIASDYPQYISKLIIVAGSIDPALEPNETWFRAPLSTPFLRWVLPKSFRASNDEIYHLKPELEKLSTAFPKIKIPVTVIQGMKDDLVPPGNADYAERMFTSAPIEIIRLPEVNHFIPWSHPEVIRKELLK